VTDPFVDWLPPQAPPTPTRDGPLRGLRLAVKDIVDVAGLPTGAGHPDWLATHPVPQRSAPVVDRITDAGAVIVGKTYTDEFAYSMFGSNAHYGTPVNPAAPGHLPGGSSSGSAVAVAAGLADIGLGTDTAGSVRIPASWCGLYGLRPTHDRASREGIVALAPSFDVPGLLCAGLATLRLAATAMLDGVGVADPAPGLRVPPDVWSLAETAVATALRPAVDRLGLPLDERPLDLPDGYVDAFAVVQGREFWRAHGDWVTAHRPRFGPGVSRRVEAAAGRTAEDEAAAQRVLRATREVLTQVGVLVLPSTPTPAPPDPPEGVPELRRRMLALETIASIGGLPAVSVPVTDVDGLPVGLCLVGPAGTDEYLLDLATLL